MRYWIKSLFSDQSAAEIKRNKILAKFAAEKDGDEIVRLSDVLYKKAKNASNVYMQKKVAPYVAPIQQAYISKLGDIHDEGARINVVNDLQHITWNAGILSATPVDERGAYVQRTAQAFIDAALKTTDPKVAKDYIDDLRECVLDHARPYSVEDVQLQDIAETAKTGLVTIMQQAAKKSVRVKAATSLSRLTDINLPEEVREDYLASLQDALVTRAKLAQKPDERLNAFDALAAMVTDEKWHYVPDDFQPADLITKTAALMYEAIAHEGMGDTRAAMIRKTFAFLQETGDKRWLSETNYQKIALPFINQLPDFAKVWTDPMYSEAELACEFLNHSSEFAAHIRADILRELGHLKPEEYKGGELAADLQVIEAYCRNKETIEKQEYADRLGAYAQKISDALTVNITDIRSALDIANSPAAADYIAVTELQQKLQHNG